MSGNGEARRKQTTAVMDGPRDDPAVADTAFTAFIGGTDADFAG